jgi:hypothetical protein
MKKIFLAAVAVFTFSFAGNANQSSLASSKSIEDIDQCLSFAIDVYVGTIARGKTDAYARELAQWAYDDCQNWE